MHAIPALCLALATMLPQPTVSRGTTVTATATVQAIDQTRRMLTLKDEDGTENTIYVPASVKRFGAVKVGDKVHVRYYESYVFQLRKPGEASNLAKDAQAVAPTAGSKPAATVAKQTTSTVDVLAVDPSVPSITIKTADGRTITRKVQKKTNLADVKPGDRIDITYTEAALISIDPAK